MTDTERTPVTRGRRPGLPGVTRRLSAIPTGGWIAALGTAKGMDSASTVVALRTRPLVEANPLVAAVHAELGLVPGELLVGLVGVLGLTAAIEATACCIVGIGPVPTPGGRAGLRATGYLTATLALLLVAVSNTVQYIVYG